MKYVVMLGDGMADNPLEEFGGRTPLEVAHKPNMDFLASRGVLGIAQTVPQGMPPGSDTANLSVMGYDPRRFYSGRSPLEAVSIGISLAADDVTFRCNLVTLSDTALYEDAVMDDYSADEISTAESAILIHDLNEQFKTDTRTLYAGISYRHCLVLAHAQTGTDCTPPHDISLKPIREHLPKGRYGAALLDLMRRSREILRDHPINLDRIARGLRPASSCWFWGEGTKPALTAFEEKFGMRGGVISAVDLIKGIGICAGLTVAEVAGATGNINTNFKGKAAAALELLRNGHDFVYIHVEAPDECGHRHEVQNKVTAIELIDSAILGTLLPALRADGEAFSVLLMPDHPTPLALRTHTADPVPFALYRSDAEAVPADHRYTEDAARATGIFVPEGYLMMEHLLHDLPF